MDVNNERLHRAKQKCAYAENSLNRWVSHSLCLWYINVYMRCINVTYTGYTLGILVRLSNHSSETDVNDLRRSDCLSTL